MTHEKTHRADTIRLPGVCGGGGLVRHGLVDGLHSVAHGELVHDLLGSLLKVDLPRVVPFGVGDLHHAVVLDVGHIVEEVLRGPK